MGGYYTEWLSGLRVGDSVALLNKNTNQIHKAVIAFETMRDFSVRSPDLVSRHTTPSKLNIYINKKLGVKQGGKYIILPSDIKSVRLNK